MKKSKFAEDFNENQIKILIDLFSYGNSWEDYIPPVKETLMKLLLCYIKSEDVEENKEQRDEVAFNIYILNDILDKFLLIDGARTPPLKEKVICKECLKKEGEIEALEWIKSEQNKRIEELITGSASDCKLAVIK